MRDQASAINAVKRAWGQIKSECLAVLGSELHYQAMIYHTLRVTGEVPITQLGMNVKMWIDTPVSDLFKSLAERKHKNYQGGFEPIPDIVIFKPEIKSDWRRRNRDQTLLNMLVAIEVKASERMNGRLQPSEIILDIEKLSAHRQEVLARGADVFPIMMVIDSAPLAKEQMTFESLKKSLKSTSDSGVGFMYISPEHEYITI